MLEVMQCRNLITLRRDRLIFAENHGPGTDDRGWILEQLVKNGESFDYVGIINRDDPHRSAYDCVRIEFPS